MTREEVKEKMFYELRFIKTRPQEYKNIIKVIDVIFDDFESRVCKNCKYDWCGCDVQNAIFRISELNDMEMPNLDDFGCNKFERKENDKN